MSSLPGSSLYESAAKIYPRRTSGRFAKLRVLATVVLLGFYYLAPWIRIGGTPLVWFDLPHRRFHVLGLHFVPQDLFLLTLMLMAAAMTLFFFTSLAGRLWCGYACPQTVWTEAFLWIEHWTEGDRHARMRLDQQPWNPQKILRKGAKHLLWLLLGLFTGFSFVAYFVPARELFPAALQFQLAGWPLFWSLFYGFATWGNAGFMREQVCKYMCPYARFQSAMFDRDTLIIAYDAPRGEPRKTLARQQARPAGDCIDCTLCVQVCPTGIDIRKGLQYECIACAACIDACDHVMDSIQKPRGLIRYTSTNHEASGRFRLLRPRVIGYGLVWGLVLSALLTLLLIRIPLQFDVVRDRHTLFRELADGSVENLYTLKIGNEDVHDHTYRISVLSPHGAVPSVKPDQMLVHAGESASQTISVSVPDEGEAERHGAHHLEFTLQALDDPRLQRRRTAAFLAGD